MNLSIDHIGFVVSDIDKAIKYWHEVLGVGPFFLVNACPKEQLYHSESTSVEMKVAFALRDDAAIELIQQTNDARSPYQEVDISDQPVMHHIALISHDLDKDTAAFEKLGCSNIFSGFGSRRFCYMDARSILGTVVELIEENEISTEAKVKLRKLAIENKGTKVVEL